MSRALFEFSSLPENLASARAFVRQFLKAEGFADRESEVLVLGVDEACSNIIRHAYAAGGPQPISLRCECQADRLCFHLRDFGAPADPAQFNRRPLAQVEPGGLGLYFMERIFDEVVYTPQSPGTELLLVKRLV
ncbi:MAG: ATP-binding protein [Verrucomicrobiota bacterium]